MSFRTSMTSWTVRAWASAAVVISTTLVCRRRASSWAARSGGLELAELLGGVADDADDAVGAARRVAPDVALGVGPAQGAVAAADAEVGAVVLAAVLQGLRDQRRRAGRLSAAAPAAASVSGRAVVLVGRHVEDLVGRASMCISPLSRSQSKLPMRLSARIGSGWAGQSSGSDRAPAPRSTMGTLCQHLPDLSSERASLDVSPGGSRPRRPAAPGSFRRRRASGRPEG